MSMKRIANGESLQLIAGVGGVLGGTPFKQGNLIGVVVADAVEGEQFTLELTGAFGTVPKATGAAWAVGDTLYWDAAASNFTKTSTSNTLAGYAYAAALSGDTTGYILLSN